MNKYLTRLIQATALTGLVALTACAGMSSQDKGTTIGAGVGAVGGVIGHETTK